MNNKHLYALKNKPSISAIPILMVLILSIYCDNGMAWLAETEFTPTVEQMHSEEKAPSYITIIPQTEFGQKTGYVETNANTIDVEQIKNTHQKILRAAYNKLMKDPSFDSSKFPTIEKILESEGVDISYLYTAFSFLSLKSFWALFNWRPDYMFSIVLTGPGPDAQTKYSDHWYNPNLSNGVYKNKGTAPEVAESYYDKLKNDLASKDFSTTVSDRDDAGKNAAYLAHFIADMSCPNHVTGLSAEDLGTVGAFGMGFNVGSLKQVFNKDKKIYETFLGEDITGQGFEDGQYKYHTPGGVTKGFAYWLFNYRIDANINWYDPWYWDAWVISEHTNWEIKHAYLEPNYNKDFINKYGYSNDYPFGTNNEVIEKFTKNIARTTRTNFAKWIKEDEAGDSLGCSVTNVYTAWRASFSAIRPQVSFKGNRLAVKIENKADEPAQNVVLRLLVDSGYKVKEDQGSNGLESLIANCGTIDKAKPWEQHYLLEAPESSENRKNGKVWIKVTANYSETPDSGEAYLREVITYTGQPCGSNYCDECTQECCGGYCIQKCQPPKVCDGQGSCACPQDKEPCNNGCCDKNIGSESGKNIDIQEPSQIIPQTNVISKEDCIDNYCTKEYNNCVEALCSPTEFGCRGSCDQIYGYVGSCPCCGGCSYIQGKQCANTGSIMKTFIADLEKCWKSDTPAICAEACQARLEAAVDSCSSASSGAATPSYGIVA